jgi:DNA polymerase III gamma/tau subunit
MKLGHAYLLVGDVAALLPEAQNLARAGVCVSGGCGNCNDCRKAAAGIHPDIITIDKEAGKRELTVDIIRSLIGDAQILPNEGERKVYILPDSGSMNANAANAFLKLLEEPPSRVMFVLIAEREKDLPQTIRSRCVIKRVNSVTEASDANNVLLSAVLSRDALAIAAECVKLEKYKRDELLQYITELFTGLVHAGETSAADKVSVYAPRLRSRMNIGSAQIAGELMVDLVEQIS